MELLISICAAILCVEAYAWLPRFSDWLIACAVARLPLSDRPRYAEEWKADLEAYLNSIVRVGHALTLVMSRAPEIIAEDNFEADMGEIDSLLASLAARFATALECRRKLGIAISRNSDVCRKFALPLQDPMEFETTSPIRLNEELEIDLIPASARNQGQTALMKFAETLDVAFGVTSRLIAESVKIIDGEIDEVKTLLNATQNLRLELSTFQCARNFRDGAITQLQNDITGNLGKLHSLLNERTSGDEAIACRIAGLSKMTGALKQTVTTLSRSLPNERGERK